MDENMEVDGDRPPPLDTRPEEHLSGDDIGNPTSDVLFKRTKPPSKLSFICLDAAPVVRDNLRDMQVKVHIRKPDRDSWAYLGRATVSQDVAGHSSRVVVRTISTGKIMAVYNENSELQAEKRGNFVVVSCVDGSKVTSWSLNAQNNSETLRLLASIELACYKCKQALSDPSKHSKTRRRIERIIKEDRRRRHKRRKDQDALIDAFAKQDLSNEVPARATSSEPNT